jgi:hemerythrin superfamily protein
VHVPSHGNPQRDPRTPQERAVTQTDSQRDVVDLLSADHREFDRIFTELEGLFGQTGPDVLRRKRELVDEVTIGLVKHSVAEETRVYPRVEDQVDREEAENSKHEHAEAEETMKRLERMDPDDPQFDTEVATLVREIRTTSSTRRAGCSPSCGRRSAASSSWRWRRRSSGSRPWRPPGRTP